MMNLWAVVPIKPLKLAKSRLASVLSAQEREDLALGLLRYNLGVLTAISDKLGGILVVSRDLDALALAQKCDGVQTLQESGTPELNHALRLARQTVVDLGADSVLVLPADLPLVERADIEAMISLGEAQNSLVIVPDRHRDGTNALLMHPPHLIDYAFGRGSFEKHLAAGRLFGVTIRVYESERLGLDLDLPADLAHYRELGTTILQET